jgi:acyl-CoA reductase-like NAD-dependent aldehyde dehydrogenase
MNIDLKAINLLCYDLNSWLLRNKDEIFRLNRLCTQDTDYSIGKDFDFITAYLSKYVDNYYNIFSQKLKAKGKIVIVLSYNEPLTTSIVPILNALVAGNRAVVKPSTKGKDIFNYIWKVSGVAKNHKLNLHVIAGSSHELLETELFDSKALYFFGGHKTAKIISQLCAKYFVQFYPEIDAADFKVVNIKKAENFDFDIDSMLTLREAFSHCGQSCQRIQGVFVHKDNFDSYLSKLEANFRSLCDSGEISNYISPTFVADSAVMESIDSVILESNPENVIRSGSPSKLPILVVNPEPDSAFVKSAYFLPMIWITKYSSTKEILSYINTRSYHLGMNIQTDSEEFKRTLVSETGFTRYTINTDHTRVREFEGWGGSWPTGYVGYRNWLDVFSYPYDILTDQPPTF